MNGLDLAHNQTSLTELAAVKATLLGLVADWKNQAAQKQRETQAGLQLALQTQYSTEQAALQARQLASQAEIAAEQDIGRLATAFGNAIEMLCHMVSASVDAIHRDFACEVLLACVPNAGANVFLIAYAASSVCSTLAQHFNAIVAGAEARRGQRQPQNEGIQNMLAASMEGVREIRIARPADETAEPPRRAPTATATARVAGAALPSSTLQEAAIPGSPDLAQILQAAIAAQRAPFITFDEAQRLRGVLNILVHPHLTPFWHSTQQVNICTLLFQTALDEEKYIFGLARQALFSLRGMLKGCFREFVAARSLDEMGCLLNGLVQKLTVLSREADEYAWGDGSAAVWHAGDEDGEEDEDEDDD